MADVIFSVNLPERIIKWVNDAVMLLGYEPEECIGKTTEFLYPKRQDFLDFGKDMASAISAGNDVFQSEVLLKKKNGDLFPTEVTVSFFRVDDKQVSATAIVRDITERMKKAQRIQEYQERLKSLASQLTIAEERERRRIAADLHDHVGQALTFARMHLCSIAKETAVPEHVEVLDEISASLKQTIKETRNLIYELSPPQLNEIGLSAAISEWLEEHIEKRYKITTDYISNVPEDHLDETLRALLFRNIRELVTNVIKHSRAETVKIRLNQDYERLLISVKDNGIGFDVNALSQSLDSEGGFGLFSIRERMSDSGGSLEIISEPGKGTEAMLSVPINYQDDTQRKL